MRARNLAIVLVATLGIAACNDLETPPPAPSPDTTSTSTPSVADDLGEAPIGSCTNDNACPMRDCTCDRYDARIQKCNDGVCATCADIGCTDSIVR